MSEHVSLHFGVYAFSRAHPSSGRYFLIVKYTYVKIKVKEKVKACIFFQEGLDVQLPN